MIIGDVGEAPFEQVDTASSVSARRQRRKQMYEHIVVSLDPYERLAY